MGDSALRVGLAKEASERVGGCFDSVKLLRFGYTPSQFPAYNILDIHKAFAAISYSDESTARRFLQTYSGAQRVACV